MKARKVAAQFAAYVWFENTQTVARTAKEKARFARKNWEAFMPLANEGLGRLLVRIQRGRQRAQSEAVCS